MGIELNISAFPRTNNLGNPTLAQKIEKDPQEYYFVKGSPEKFESVEEAVNGVNPPADGFVTLYHHVPKHDSRDAWRHAGEGALIGLAV
ncbi:MAG: hypothetical protein HYU64_02935, partial [Armatimonadetes bacterium]|nr:hypothetical protein [Armatimonadota bacterium]